MLLPKQPPKSSTERQREYRERNPGCDARRKATVRAREKAAFAVAMERFRLAARWQEPLLLPAPVERVPLPWELETAREREAIVVER